MNMKFGERYYDEWLGEVYSILLDGEEIGAVDYIEEGGEVYVRVLSIAYHLRDFELFEGAVNILKSMFPGKLLTGLTGPIGCYCGDPEYWVDLGAITYPDPDDAIFTVFELQC